MDTVMVEMGIYSPRWGHKDIYTVKLAKDSMEVTQGGRSAVCTWKDNSDPEWTGEDLEEILRNDNIYPPAILRDLIEHAWKAWRDGNLDFASVDSELQAVANWINEVTKSKPNTDFWSKYF